MCEGKLALIKAQYWMKSARAIAAVVLGWSLLPGEVLRVFLDTKFPGMFSAMSGVAHVALEPRPLAPPSRHNRHSKRRELPRSFSLSHTHSLYRHANG